MISFRQILRRRSRGFWDRLLLVGVFGLALFELGFGVLVVGVLVVEVFLVGVLVFGRSPLVAVPPSDILE